MKKILALSLFVCFISGISFGDIFAEGTANEFTIDFVTISGDAGDLGNWPAGNRYTFSGVNHGDYRMGKLEITNAQWDKFKANIAPMQVTGSPSNAYDLNPHYIGTNVPTNCASWYEAAQFVNWLNTSSGKTAAYKFSGTQGTSGYTLEVWQPGDAGYNASNPYRNSNAYYFLPTEDEWVKAAYWNGTMLQTYTTKAGETLFQGNGTNGGWNYYEGDDSGPDGPAEGPWDVGSGSEELNGTFDMMGNVWEWMESPWYSGDYLSVSIRGVRGGSYYYTGYYLSSSRRHLNSPYDELSSIGFRVASVPEPASLMLLALGGLFIRKR